MLDRSEVGKRGYLNEGFRLFHLKDSNNTRELSGVIRLNEKGTASAEETMDGDVSGKLDVSDTFTIAGQSVTMNGNVITVNSPVSYDPAADGSKTLFGTAMNLWVVGSDDSFIILKLTPPADWEITDSSGKFKTITSGGDVATGTFKTDGTDDAYFIFGWEAGTDTEGWVEVQWSDDGGTTWTDATRIWITGL